MSNEMLRSVETIIIGYGFSARSIIRELEQSGREFLVLSHGSSVWEKLAASDRLDFDLVSSRFTSYYSYDLLDQLRQGPVNDIHPTSREFRENLRKYHKQYRHHVVDAIVDEIENHTDYSLVKTQSGDTYRATHVVLATGFRRKILRDLTQFDFSIKNQTVVLDFIGDTANLIISKLIPGNNTIVCLQNGFLPLDKIYRTSQRKLVVEDQQEFHQLAFISPKAYNDIILTASSVVPMYFRIDPAVRSEASAWRYYFSKVFLEMSNILFKYVSFVFSKHHYFCKFDHRRTVYADQKPRYRTMIAQAIAVKHWPIDAYKELFSTTLKNAISKGYLLNDIVYFVNRGLVNMWPKSEAKVNSDSKTVTWKDRTIQYDHFIENEREEYAVPPIKIFRNGELSDFCHEARQTYLGIAPTACRNLYIIGAMRPITGGSANINEMQSMFIHRMIADVNFNKRIYQTIHERNATFFTDLYITKTPRPTDYVMSYGVYNEYVARILGIHLRFKDCRSLMDLYHWLFFPGNAFRYRQRGAYALEGIDELIQRATQEADYFKLPMMFSSCYFLYRLLFIETMVLLWINGSMSLIVMSLFIILQHLFSKIFTLPTQNYYGFGKAIYLTLSVLALPFIPIQSIFVILAIDFTLTFVIRQRYFSYLLSDTKRHDSYDEFFDTYISTYNDVVTSADHTRSDALEKTTS